jgi:uncharacterized membrane protein
MSDSWQKPDSSMPVTMADVRIALPLGVADFKKAPFIGIFFGGIYAFGGIALYLILWNYRAPWLILPLALGFPLIAPFVAAGVYETSRRLERDEPIRWDEILTVVFRQSHRELGWMAFAVLFIFWIWMYQVRLMLALFLGFKAFSSAEGLMSTLQTREGYAFLAAGTVSGGVLAIVLYCATVISMPMLLHRDVDFITAIITSFRTVFSYPGPMIAYGLIVAISTLTALLPMFLGLLVVLPVLGHATFHLYARTIGRSV